MELVYDGHFYDLNSDKDLGKITAENTIPDQGQAYAHFDVKLLLKNIPSGVDDYGAWVVIDTDKGTFISDWYKVSSWKSYDGFLIQGDFLDPTGKDIATLTDIRNDNGIFYIQHTINDITNITYEKATMYYSKYTKWRDYMLNGGVISPLICLYQVLVPPANFRKVA